MSPFQIREKRKSSDSHNWIPLELRISNFQLPGSNIRPNILPKNSCNRNDSSHSWNRITFSTGRSPFSFLILLSFCSTCIFAFNQWKIYIFTMCFTLFSMFFRVQSRWGFLYLSQEGWAGLVAPLLFKNRRVQNYFGIRWLTVVPFAWFSSGLIFVFFFRSALLLLFLPFICLPLMLSFFVDYFPCNCWCSCCWMLLLKLLMCLAFDLSCCRSMPVLERL